MKQVREVEYAICRNGQYVTETYDTDLKEGGFTFTPCIDYASTYPSAENAEKFVEDEMRLNINNVSIHRIIYHTPLITPLVQVNGVFVNLDTVEQCKTCNKWFPHIGIYKYKHDKESTYENYCEPCYAKMDSKYPNSFHGNQDSDVSEVAEHYAKLHKYYDEKRVK